VSARQAHGRAAPGRAARRQDAVAPDALGQDVVPVPAPSAGRRRAILVVLALALAAPASGVPVWMRTSGSTALQGIVPVQVTGTQAAPAVPAAALVLLAAGIAIGLAGRLGRWVVVGAVVLSGLLQAAAAAAALADPAPTARTVVAAETGVELLASPVRLTPWPWIALVVGVLVVLAGVWLGVTSRRWARPSDRHDVAPGGTSTTPPPDDDQAAWDALTRGHDPS
jgi:hypothetical protein